MGEPHDFFKTAALREVNAHILDAARESVAPDEHWEFFCECGQEECHEHVELTLDAYVALHDAGRAVLAPGHRLSQIARARLLAADAEALQRQAQHQVRRARRNLNRQSGGGGTDAAPEKIEPLRPPPGG